MNMKKAILYACALLTLVSTGCDKGDGDKEYGYAYVMMPQSQRLEGYYNVPGGSEKNTRNYIVEEDKVLVCLGVLRSGNVADEAFSVELTTPETPVGDFIYDGIIPGAEAMPASLYTLPSKVDVASGSNASEFYMELDRAQLAGNAGKTFVLCIELANPTRYKLAREAYRTMVVVRVDDLLALI
jgi:hypothetical protein